MLPLLLLFSLMVHLAGAASTECPATDPACSNYRSVWNIISTCAFTLIICIWNATYPNITLGERWYKVVFYRAALALLALVTPEVTIVRAYSEWRYAGQIRGDFSSQQWTRAHGFFALMQGFNLQDGTRRQLLKTRDDLICLREGKIINPKITKEEIHGRSKSDGLRNTLLALQLSWFILQVITRATNHLAITLVELDTLALAVLSLPLFFFWWSKPMEVECRHVFYSSTSSSAGDGDGQTTSSELDAAFSVSRSKDEWLRELTIGGAYSNDIGENILVLSLGWLVFGGLHLIAWDFQFPSQAEKIAWRVASLALIAAPGLFFLDYYGVRWYYMIGATGVLAALPPWLYSAPDPQVDPRTAPTLRPLVDRLVVLLRPLVVLLGSLVVRLLRILSSYSRLPLALETPRLLTINPQAWDSGAMYFLAQQYRPRSDRLGAAASKVFILSIALVARVVLLVLMVLSLRNLPHSAHETVSWTVYIPHIL